MVDTATDVVTDRAGQGLGTIGMELVAEGVGLVASGLRLRNESLSIALSGWTVGWARDIRFALRTLLRSPGFTTVAVLTLGLGIGANGAVFSLMDGVLFAPPPYEEPGRLVLVWNRLVESAERIPVSGPDAAEIEETVNSFSSTGFALRALDGSVEWTDGGSARPIRISAVAPGFFATLGVEPALGRGFTAEDASGVEGGEATRTIVSHELFQQLLGGDPSTIGRSIRINGRSAVVAGVLPPEFTLVLSPDAGMATEIDVWIPLAVPLTSLHRTDGRLLDQDSDNTGIVVGRLAPGATRVQAQAELDALATRLATEVPLYAEAGLGFHVRGLHEDATAHARPLLVALMLGVGGVLLVACLNIATLMTVRSSARHGEFAVRTCLGAGRGRLVRQLLLENAVLVALGLLTAAGLAQAAVAAFSNWVPTTLAPPEPLALRLRTLVFMAALGGGAAFL
ncbi:MAG: ABC transporter permease, partial [Longimicrobiales bacterium]|nr:ABC transporter permease [Longimicrobiales bacterium]